MPESAPPSSPAARARRRVRARLLVPLALAVVALLGGGPRALCQITEGRLKSLFVERFTRFIEWPGHALPEGAPFVVCILGSGETAEDLFEVARTRKFKERLCEVRRVRVGSSFDACHLLYVAGSEAARLPQITASTTGRPILTVSDETGFAERGVLINLFEEGKGGEKLMHFEINLAAVKRSKLVFSSQLLRLGRLVGGDGAEGEGKR